MTTSAVNKVRIIHAACLALIGATVAAAWFVPWLQANPAYSVSLIGAACTWYAKATGKPLSPVLAKMIGDMEPEEVQRLSAMHTEASWVLDPKTYVEKITKDA